MALKSIAQRAPVIFSVRLETTPADGPVFVADRDYVLQEVIETHSATAAGATVMIEKAAAGTAAGSGTDLLGTAFACDSTANTPVRKNIANGGLVASGATRQILAGQTLMADVSGTLTNYVGCLTFVLQPVGTGGSY